MAIYVEINPREREATLRSAHSLCAGESAEVVLSGTPDADTETLSLRLYRDRSEAEFVAAARRPGDADPPQEGFAAVQGRAAMRRAVLDLRSESVASWASDVFEQSGSESDGPEGAPKPPETAWMVVADISRVWAACEVPFLLRPMSPESADVALTLPSLVERATSAAESAERSASAASASALEASQAAARAEAATSGKADLEDGKVPASQLPPFRGKTDLTVDPDFWVLVKPDGAKAVLLKDAQPGNAWRSEEGGGPVFAVVYGDGVGSASPGWSLLAPGESAPLVGSNLDADAAYLGFTGTLGVYRLYRATELATDADIARLLKGKYEKPAAGIPATDFAPSVQTSLGKADTAVQPAALEHKRDKTDLSYDRPDPGTWVVHPPSGDPVPLIAVDGSANTWTEDGTLQTAGYALRRVSVLWFLAIPDDVKEDSFDSAAAAAAATSLDFGDGYTVTWESPGATSDSLALVSQLAGKADKSEMSVTPGTGADADKTTIQLKSGTTATVLTQHQDISGKQDALSAAQLANIAAVPGKADASALRYALEQGAVVAAALPQGVTIVMRDGSVVTDYQFQFDEPIDLIVLSAFDGSLELAEWNLNGGAGSYAEDTIEFMLNGSPIEQPDLVLNSFSPADRAVTRLAPTAGTPSINLQMPAAQSGKVRDFYVCVDNTAQGASNITLSAQSATLKDASGNSVTLTAPANAVTTWHFTELKSAASSPSADPVFLVTGANEAQTLAAKENASNKVTTLSAQSTNAQYPSAKCVYDLVGDIETALATINNGSAT